MDTTHNHHGATGTMTTTRNSHTTNRNSIPTNLNGCWVLDKSRGNWSMRGYLEAMDVNELAIQAHEKGEQEHDILQTIQLTLEKLYMNKKQVLSTSTDPNNNNHIVVELDIGVEKEQRLSPGERIKTSLATLPLATASNNTNDALKQLKIQNSLTTINGKANVIDLRTFEHKNQNNHLPPTMIQKLTIVNETTGKTNETIRYFIPYTNTNGDAPPAPASATNPDSNNTNQQQFSDS